MMDVGQLICEICDDETACDDGVDLLESGLLDSLAFIELFARLEDEGIFLQPTQIDRNRLRTAKGIEELIREYEEQNGGIYK